MGASRILAGLYMGSKPPTDKGVGDDFNLIVLCAKEYQPSRRYFHPSVVLHVPLDDAMPTEQETRDARSAGACVASAVRRGMRALVTCQMGWNRSGWVTGFALMGLGDDVDTAVRRIKAARGPNALSNPFFVDVLRRYEGKINPVRSQHEERTPHV